MKDKDKRGYMGNRYEWVSILHTSLADLLICGNLELIFKILGNLLSFFFYSTFFFHSNRNGRSFLQWIKHLSYMYLLPTFLCGNFYPSFMHAAYSIISSNKVSFFRREH